ncbi:MAG: ABC transporter permease [Anaerolineae bacterium]|nr:ABC transporter permease [Anaerolineae bacterium]
MSSSTETPLDRYSMAEDVLTDALEQEEAAAETRTGWQQFLGRLLVSRDLAILIVAILIFAFFVAANPRFAQTLNMVSLARRMATLGVVAVGMTYLFVAGEIDLSVGANFGFLMMLLSIIIEKQSGNPWLASVGVLGLGLIIGAINGILVTRVGVPAFITTLGTWVALRGFFNVLSGGIATNATRTDLDFYKFFQSDLPGTRIPVIFAIMVVVVVIGALVLARTRFGSDLYATGGDMEAARNNGINTRRVKLMAFIITGGLCGLAGILQFGRIGNVPFGAGNGFELQVIASIIVGGVGLFGGRGTIFGALVGVFIYSMITSGIIFLGVKDFWDGVVSGIIILIIAGLDVLVRRGAARVLGRAEK